MLIILGRQVLSVSASKLFHQRRKRKLAAANPSSEIVGDFFDLESCLPDVCLFAGKLVKKALCTPEF